MGRTAGLDSRLRCLGTKMPFLFQLACFQRLFGPYHIDIYAQITPYMFFTSVKYEAKKRLLKFNKDSIYKVVIKFA